MTAPRSFDISECATVEEMASWLLRCPPEAELAGLDITEVPVKAYPESRIPAFGDGSLSPAE